MSCRQWHSCKSCPDYENCDDQKEKEDKEKIKKHPTRTKKVYGKGKYFDLFTGETQ